ncbi:hypothetical protein BKM14_12140 [Pseudomonas syringae pv. syringae]|nr:hypothetical protein BKM14_12140 [Pseudomonas syringae pv. syringae]
MAFQIVITIQMLWLLGFTKAQAGQFSRPIVQQRSAGIFGFDVTEPIRSAYSNAAEIAALCGPQGRAYVKR